MELEEHISNEEGGGGLQRLWIKADEKLIEVANGSIWDPGTKEYFQPDFFYESENACMINIELGKILTQLSPPFNKEIVSSTPSNVIARKTESKTLDIDLLFKNIEALRNQVHKLTESVESQKKQLMLAQNTSASRYTAPAKRRKPSSESSKDLFSLRDEYDGSTTGSERIPLSQCKTRKSSKSTPSSNRKPVLTCRIRQQDSDSSCASRETSIGSIASPRPQVVKNARIHIRKNVISIIERWFDKNEAMVRRLYGLKSTGNRGIDDKSLNRLLTHINPLVTLVKISKYTIERYKKKYFSRTDKIVERKEVFARNLGLVRRSIADNSPLKLLPQTVSSMVNVTIPGTSTVRNTQESSVKRKLSFSSNKQKRQSSSSDTDISSNSSYSSTIDSFTKESIKKSRMYTKSPSAVRPKRSTPKPAVENGDRNKNNVASPVKGNISTRRQSTKKDDSDSSDTENSSQSSSFSTKEATNSRRGNPKRQSTVKLIPSPKRLLRSRNTSQDNVESPLKRNSSLRSQNKSDEQNTKRISSTNVISSERRIYPKRQSTIAQKTPAKLVIENGNTSKKEALSPSKGNRSVKSLNKSGNSSEPKRSGLRKSPQKILTSRYVPDKTAYSTREDEVILKWVLEGARSTQVNGNSLWKQLENKKLMPTGGRKWQSLRTRYLKTILSQLRNYGLSYQEEMQLKVGAVRGCIKRASNKYKENSAALSKYKKPKLPIDLKEYNHYKKEDILKDNTEKMSYKSFKDQEKRKSPRGDRKLFTQQSFIVTASQNTSSIPMK